MLSLCQAAHSYCVDAKNEWHAHPHVLAFVFPFTNAFSYHTLLMFSNGFFFCCCSGCRCHCNPHHGAEVPVTCAGVQAPLRAGDGGKCLNLYFSRPSVHMNIAAL